MRRPRGLPPIIIVFVLQHLQHQMMRPFVPLYAASLDAGFATIGVIVASLALLPMFLAVPVGSLADRVGVRPLVTAGAVLGGASYIVLAFTPSIPIIILSQVVAGVANLLIVLAAQSYVGSLGRGIAAERNFSLYTIWASVGQIAGPVTGGILVSLIGFQGAFLTAASLSSLALIAAFILLPAGSRSPSTEPQPALPRRAWQYLRHRPTVLAILASCLMSVPEILRTSFLPIYLGTVVALDPAWTGYVLSLFSVAGLIAKTVLPRVVARFGRMVMLFTITTACAATVAAIPLFHNWIAIAVITLLMGATFGLGRPLSMAMAANSAEDGDMGMVVGLRISGNRFADFVFPLTFGGVAALAGIGGAFLPGAALMLAGAAFLWGPMRQERGNASVDA